MAVRRARSPFAKQAVSILWVGLSWSQQPERPWGRKWMWVAVNYCPNRKVFGVQLQPAELEKFLFHISNVCYISITSKERMLDI